MTNPGVPPAPRWYRTCRRPGSSVAQTMVAEVGRSRVASMADERVWGQCHLADVVVRSPIFSPDVGEASRNVRAPNELVVKLKVRRRRRRAGWTDKHAADDSSSSLGGRPMRTSAFYRSTSLVITHPFEKCCRAGAHSPWLQARHVRSLTMISLTDETSFASRRIVVRAPSHATA